jgi:SAM-dependent methyltransferase
MTSSTEQEGVYGIEYYYRRRTKRALKYRLARRADETVRAVKRVAGYRTQHMLDLGTADGLTLQRVLGMLDTPFAIGVDLSLDLLSVIETPAIRPVLADGIRLPFVDGFFDLLIATAVIEHVSKPLQMLSECLRVLVPGGLCVITTPDPFWEQVATGIGHLPEEGHVETLNLKRLRTFLEITGFEVLEAYKFMMSPWGFPAELFIEHVMRTLGLSFMLLNQIVVARRPLGSSSYRETR